MAKGEQKGKKTAAPAGVEMLRQNGMMAHLLDSLEQGKDIGHYGRLVFVMIGRHFLDEDEMVELLQQDRDVDDEKARALVQDVVSRGYNPPRREKILEFQSKQEFPICPNSEDPDTCNVYKDLQFPDGVYEHIQEYREQKAEADD